MDVGSQSAAAAAVASTPPVPYFDPGSAGTVAPAVLGASGATAPQASAEGQTSAVLSASPQRLSSAVSAIFAGSTPHSVEVSLRVAHHPNEIIAVFRDAQTGEVINQVPSETIVRLAEFFQQEASGALLDQDA